MLEKSMEKELKRIRIQGEIRELKDELEKIKSKRNSTISFLLPFTILSVLIFVYVGFSVYSSYNFIQSDLPPELTKSVSLFGVGEIFLICLCSLVMFFASFIFIKNSMNIQTTKEILEIKQNEYNSIL